jgi:hypothetical protein
MQENDLSAGDPHSASRSRKKGPAMAPAFA